MSFPKSAIIKEHTILIFYYLLNEYNLWVKCFYMDVPYSSGSSVKDVIVDFTLIIPVGFHLERVIGRQKTKQNKPPRFLQLKNPSTLHSKISCHLGFLPLKEGTEVGSFPLLVRRAVTGNVKGKQEDTSGKY